MKMYWLKGHNKTQEQKEKRKAQVMSYRNAFDDLREVLLDQFAKQDAVREYGPGWEYKQIAVNEYNRALSDILETIDLNQKDK